MRMQITIDTESKKDLEALAQQRRTSQSEVIRQLIVAETKRQINLTPKEDPIATPHTTTNNQEILC